MRCRFFVEPELVDDSFRFFDCCRGLQAHLRPRDQHFHSCLDAGTDLGFGLFPDRVHLLLKHARDGRDVRFGLRRVRGRDRDRRDLLVSLNDPFGKSRIGLGHALYHGLRQLVDAVRCRLGGVHDDIRHRVRIHVQPVHSVHVHVDDEGFREEVLVDGDHIFKIQLVVILFLIKGVAGEHVVIRIRELTADDLGLTGFIHDIVCQFRQIQDTCHRGRRGTVFLRFIDDAGDL